MGKVKYDWARIDIEYITGDMSLRELAVSEGIPYHSLAGRSRKIRYDDRRTEYKRTVLKKLEQSACRRDVNAIQNLMTATEKAITLVDKYMADDATLHNYVVGHTEKRLKKLDTKALRNMSGVLRDVACTLKLLYPDSTEDQGSDERVIIMPERKMED